MNWLEQTNMADMSPKYRKYVDGFTKHLRHRDVEKRRKAARMVGELGAAETIETLIKMAENDPDAVVRKNAAYSLGMFAAFKEAVEGEDEDKQQEAIEAITRVMETGQVGKPAKYNAAKLRPVIFGLAGVLVLLLIANVAVFVLSSGDGLRLANSNGNQPDTTTNTVANQELDALVATGLAQIDQLTLNADKLQALYEGVDEAGAPVLDQCLLPYDSTDPIEISAEDRQSFPPIAAVYDDINETAEQFSTARTRIEQACFDEIPLEAGESDTPLANVATFRENATAWRAALAEAVATPTPPPTEPAEAPASATDVPAEPTVPVNLRPYIAETRDIIDRTGIAFVAQGGGGRGPAVLLEQYWQEAQSNNGVTDGCRNTALAIPSVYVPSNPDEFEAAVATAPDLQIAVNQMNAGLELLQEQVTVFRNACASGDAAVLSAAPTGIETLAQAKAILQGADEQLAGLIGS